MIFAVLAKHSLHKTSVRFYLGIKNPPFVSGRRALRRIERQALDGLIYPVVRNIIQSAQG